MVRQAAAGAEEAVRALHVRRRAAGAGEDRVCGRARRQGLFRRQGDEEGSDDPVRPRGDAADQPAAGRRRNSDKPVAGGAGAELLRQSHAARRSRRSPCRQCGCPPAAPAAKRTRRPSEGRGKKGDNFAFEYAVSRGYALATFYHGDVDPDQPRLDRRRPPALLKQGQKEPGPHEWGAIAAWAWGLSRAVDYLVQDRSIDKDRIVVYGHSRNGKTALLAGAFDERIAAVIPHQAGCGGTSPGRGKTGEQLRDINKNFPHWFNDTYVEFNEQPERCPSTSTA